MKRKNAGFTLMELLTVIAMVGILSAVAVPNVMSWRQNREYSASVQRVMAVLRAAKARAVKENVRTVVVFDAAEHNFTAFVDRNLNDAWDKAAVPRESRIDFYEMPKGARITNVTFGGGVVRFDGRGMPIDSSGAPIDPGHVELTGFNGVKRDVSVNLTGRVRID